MERLRGSYLDMMKTLAADEQLRYGFLPHDVGKVGLPEAVLNKPGPLDAREWEVMRAHPLPGVQMVAGSKSLGSAVEVIRWHHERWDGKGYPSGLAGEAIPAGARVLSVADAFDAIVPDLHASLHERSLHDRSPHGGPPHDGRSVDGLARANP
jgi:HD-GYP domain-containing protein (c-di-GMP phosphodiesterase class II)